MLLQSYNFFLNLDLEFLMSENCWLVLGVVMIDSCPSICLQEIRKENLALVRGVKNHSSLHCMLEERL